MLGIGSSAVQAATAVGSVLAQALVLYVGYGGLERVIGPKVTAAIERR